MRTTLQIVGILAVLAGLVWAAQGSGIFPYPVSSFMINEARWITIGLVTAVVGAVVIVIARQL